MDQGIHTAFFDELPSIYNQLTCEVVEEDSSRMNFIWPSGAVSIFKGLSVNQQGCKQGP